MEESKEIKTVDDLPYIMKEFPFIRDGMTIAEYEEERDYWGMHLEEVKNGTYIPLWKQRLLKQ